MIWQTQLINCVIIVNHLHFSKTIPDWRLTAGIGPHEAKGLCGDHWVPAVPVPSFFATCSGTLLGSNLHAGCFVRLPTIIRALADLERCLPVGCGKQVRFCLCFGSITQEAPEFLENLRVKAGFFVDFSICEIIRDAFYFRQSQPILPVNFLEVSQVIGTSWYVQSR